VKCSIQDSSLATESCIWLGCSDPNPQVCVPGEGWKPIPMPEGDIAINTRMHLNQEMVQKLLPSLQFFAENGQLPTEDDLKDDTRQELALLRLEEQQLLDDLRCELHDVMPLLNKLVENE